MGRLGHSRRVSLAYLSNVHLLSLQVKSMNIGTFVKCFTTATLNLE